MSKLNELKEHLQRGEVYRREDLARWTTSVDRHLEELLAEKTLEKLSQGLYYYPKESVFGKTPPDDRKLVRSFLKDDRFLLTSPNAYNSLGMGTTQLYNTRTVYNRKRKGEFSFGNRKFNFKVLPDFPAETTLEYLLVDLLNNLKNLAEDPEQVLARLPQKARAMDPKKLGQAVALYGTPRARKILSSYVSA